MIMKLDEEYFRQEQKKIRSFIETGFFTLSVILIASLAIVYSQKKMPADKSVMSNSLIHNKELPIYCVDTKKPVVALSFDAAWGAYRSLNTIFVPPHFFHMLTKKHRHFYINCSLYDALPSYLPSAAGMYNHAFYHI
jgi:hypothetical protein